MSATPPVPAPAGGHPGSQQAVFAFEAQAASVPQARHAVRSQLLAWDGAAAHGRAEAVLGDVELVVSELVANVVLHVGDTAVVSVERTAGPTVVVAVADSSPHAPRPRPAEPGQASTTGRGLGLVAAVSREWGVRPRRDARPGKEIWACLAAPGATPPTDEDEPAGGPTGQPDDAALDALLRAFGEPDPEGPPLLSVELGEAPVGLVLADHEQSEQLVRELVLAAGRSPGAGVAAGGASVAATQLGAGQAGTGDVREAAVAPGADLGPGFAAAVHRFQPVRQQMAEQARAARSAGRTRVPLRLQLAADGEEMVELYARGLQAADDVARDARMLVLETPIEQRVLRTWYLGGLREALAAHRDGAPARPQLPFEAVLVAELRAQEQAARAHALAARLQQVTAALAEAETPRDVAAVVLAEGCEQLGASGATLISHSGGETVVLAEHGGDVGVAARLPVASTDLAAGAGTEPRWAENAGERDEHFPGLDRVQPDVVAVASLPLTVAGGCLGTVRFGFAGPHAFDAAERAYLAALAAQAASALARTDALSQLHGLRDEVQRLAASGSVSPVDLAVLRTLYEDAPMGIVVFDHRGRFLRANQLITSATGRPAADHVGRTLAELVTGGPLAAVADLLEQVLRTGAPATALVTVPPTGQQGAAAPPGARRAGRAWQTSWFPVRDRDDAVEAVVVVSVDVTAAQAAEQARRSAEAQAHALARLGESLAEARTTTAVADAVVDLVLGDPALPELGEWCVLHLVEGRSEQAPIRYAAARHLQPELTEALRALFSRFPITRDQPAGAGWVIATGRSRVMAEVTEAMLARIADDPDFLALMSRIGTRSGVVVPLLARGRTLGALSIGSGRPEAVSAAGRALLEDVGRRAGVALDNVAALATSVRLEVALTASDVGSYELDLASGRVEWDDRMLRLFRVDPADFDGTLDAVLSRVTPEDRPWLQAAMDHAVATIGELSVEFRITWPDGSLRWVQARGRALAGASGAAERLLGVVVDITEQRAHRDRVVRALEVMADAFFSLDPQWRFTYVNRQAEIILERPREELLDRCVWEEFPTAVGTAFQLNYERAVATGQPVRFEQYFPALDRLFEVRAYPTAEGLSVYFTDVAHLRATELERDRALGRLDLLDRVGATLSATLDLDEALHGLADLLVPAVADLVTIDLQEPGQPSRAAVITGRDPGQVAAMIDAERTCPRRDNPGSTVHRVLHGAPPWLGNDLSAHLDAAAVSPQQRRDYDRAGLRHAMVVPLQARGRVFGALSVLRTARAGQPPPAEPMPFDDGDAALLLDVGRRAGQMVDTVLQFAAQRRVAEALQRDLLPELPEVAGVALGAAYDPSSREALVGGDWYDAFTLPDGALGVVIGDVMGHDIAAAAAMGQLRSVVRTCAASGDSPAVVLDRLDRLVSSFALADLATVVYARLERQPDGSALLTWANAGHPPPLVLLPAEGGGSAGGSDTARFLEAGSSTMIGATIGAWTDAATGPPRPEARETLPPGATLVLITDGLVERRDADIDERLEALRRQALELWRDRPDPATLCRLLLSAGRADNAHDDAAVMALTVLAPP